MRPRIKKHPTLVASSSNDETIQSICEFNRNQLCKEKQTKSYILTCFGKTKTISKLEYDYYISQGLSDLVQIKYV